MVCNKMLHMTDDTLKTLQPNKDYFDYLNEIGEGKKNIVIDKTVELVLKKFESIEKVAIADIGCYNGVMLSVIHKIIPENLREKVELYGYDYDREILKKGSEKFSHIKFIYNDLTKPFKDTRKYDIVIVSNVLHEIYSNLLPDIFEAEQAVSETLRHIIEKIKKSGFLIFMDGVFPEKQNTIVEVLIESDELVRKLKIFSENFLINFTFEKNSDGVIKISLRDLSMFLSKFKYMERSYWTLESKQVYQYFDSTRFHHLFKFLKMNVVEEVVQENTSVQNMVKIINPSGFQLPPKNVLFVCQKS